MADPGTKDEIVEHLAELDADERAAWLDEHVDDAALRGEVERALAEIDAVVAGGGPRLADLVAANDLARAPTEIGGYHVRARIGEGGMGTVYLAHDPRVDQMVALKTVRGEAALRRFTLEAQALGRLDHPGIVPVHEFEVDAPEPYLVMDYVPGESLEARLALERQRDVAPAEPERQRFYAEFVARVAEALDHAHDHGVVHRDVKPANILVDLDGRPRVTDFGVAKLEDTAPVTRTGERPGTLRYMSPEQARAERGGGIDRRSDVFSLGVVLYECLTLSPAFSGSTEAAVLNAVCEEHPQRPARRAPGIAGDLERIVVKALEKLPSQRYQSASDLATDLRAWLDGREVQAPPLTWTRSAARWLRRHRGGLASVVVVGVALLAGIEYQRWSTTPRARLVLEAFTNAPRDPDGRVDLRVARLGLADDVEDIAWSDTVAWRAARIVDVAPGRYRVEARGPDGWAADGVVVLAARGRTPLRLCLVSGDAADDEMVFVPPRGSRPAFRVDRDEVSNARFAEFLASLPADEAARLRPTWWPPEGPPAALVDRPVVGVTYEAAACFAAWDGKRLLTADEWERAVGDTDGRAFPWADEPPSDPACFANTRLGAGFGPVLLDLARHVPNGPRHADLLAELEQRLQPVGSPAPAAPCDDVDPSARDETPAGVRHLFGNVMEWTSSPAREMWLSDGATVEFAVKGRAWRDARPDHTIVGGEGMRDGAPASTWHASGLAPTKRLAGVGFRCARSVPGG